MIPLLKKRRSIRLFQDRKVEKEKIYQIMQAALLAPSSKDNNPWKFIIVEDRETLIKLSEAKEHGSNLLAKVPLAIVVLADPGQSDVWIEDASIATTLIIMEAQQLGLGSCWIQLRRRYRANGEDSETYLRNLLGIPNNLNILCMVAIGYPDEIKPEKIIPEQKFNDIFLNRYNQKYNF